MKIIWLFILSLQVGAFAMAKASIHQVTIESMQFHPAELEVKKGDVIVWTNKDIVPHTVTAASLFDSNTIEPEKTFRYRIKKTGEIPYVCRFHPTMKALIKSH